MEWTGRPNSNRKEDFVYSAGTVAMSSITTGATNAEQAYIYDGLTPNLNVVKNMSKQTVRARFTVIENEEASIRLDPNYLPHQSELFDYRQP